MRSCQVPLSCRDGNTSGRKQRCIPAPLPRRMQNKSRLCYQRSPGNGDYQFSQVQLAVLRRNILRINSSPRLDWIRQGLVELGTRFSLQRNASTEKESGGCRRLKEASYDSYLGDGSGTGGGSGDDGSSWHWSSGWGNGRDEGGNWFGQGQAFLVFLLGYLIKHAFGNTLVPAIFLPLFFQRDLLAHADANLPPLKPSPSTDENGNEASAEKGNSQPEPDAVFEVRGGTWTRLLLDIDNDEFVVDPVKELDKDSFDRGEHVQDQWEKPLHNRGSDWAIKCCFDFIKNILLPDGYPESVTADYLNYTLWRMGQNIASQVNGVLTTQALLYAVGLGKGAIPTAAAVNWVLKDGIGYLSKILLADYGRHFDVHPKGWRLLADLLENASYALELLTPIYPHLFVFLGAAAGAGKSAAGLIQAATRSCFYAGFAAQRNFAEVIAKGEAQGMVSKFLGITLGISISASVGASGPRLVTTFLTVTGIHMFCNLKSYQAVQLCTLNPYRACLVFGEYIRGGVVASVEEVNAAEPIFAEIPFLLFKHFKHKESLGNVLSLETKEDAASIASKLKLGVSFPNVIKSQSEANRLFKVYRDEKYVLVDRENTYQALLKEGATSRDLLKLMLQVCYLHQLRTGPAEGGFDFYVSSPIEISHRLAVNKFDLIQKQLSSAGWSISDGLVARPLPYRLLNV
ncbi:hypothetical protein L7F22_004826 [Adiantum nelumboides]|nr:hypothetical protein [Adiantum nelumboides]